MLRRHFVAADPLHQQALDRHARCKGDTAVAAGGCRGGVGQVEASLLVGRIVTVETMPGQQWCDLLVKMVTGRASGRDHLLSGGRDHVDLGQKGVNHAIDRRRRFEQEVLELAQRLAIGRENAGAMLASLRVHAAGAQRVDPCQQHVARAAGIVLVETGGGSVAGIDGDPQRRRAPPNWPLRCQE